METYRPSESEVKPLSFEAQFLKREIIQTSGGDAEVVDIRPENPLKNEQGELVPPIILATGWGVPLEVYVPLLKQAFGSGRRIIALSQPRLGESIKATTDWNTKLALKRMADNPETRREVKTVEEEAFSSKGLAQNLLSKVIQKELDTPNPSVLGRVNSLANLVIQEESFSPRTSTIRRMQAFIGVVKQKGLDKVDVIGHSEGSFDAVVTAYYTSYEHEFSYNNGQETAKQGVEPFIRNIVLVNPAGLIGRDNLLFLLGRFIKDIKQSITTKGVEDPDFSISEDKKINPVTKIVRYMAKHPGRVIEESRAISGAKVIEMLKFLSNIPDENKRVKISVVAGERDKLFPAKRIASQLKLHPSNLIRDFYILPSTHKMMDSKEFASIPIQALSRLESAS